MGFETFNGVRKDIFPGRTLSIKITLHKTRKTYFLDNEVILNFDF